MKYQKSLKRELELIRHYRKLGKIVSRLDGRDGFNLVVVDTLEKTVSLIYVGSKKGATFRVDRDVRVEPGWNLRTMRVTYDGVVDR